MRWDLYQRDIKILLNLAFHLTNSDISQLDVSPQSFCDHVKLLLRSWLYLTLCYKHFSTQVLDHLFCKNPSIEFSNAYFVQILSLVVDTYGWIFTEAICFKCLVSWETGDHLGINANNLLTEVVSINQRTLTINKTHPFTIFSLSNYLMLYIGFYTGDLFVSTSSDIKVQTWVISLCTHWPGFLHRLG